MTPRPMPPGLPEVLGGIAAALKIHFGPQLRTYTQALRDRLSFHRPQAKVINDSIWKTVRLEPWEVLVLDCPVVQRLRQVRQLGLAHLVFPTAGYSRFEHSVGVLHQMQRMVEALNHNARNARHGIEPILPSDAVLLRLAALLHDVGHGFLSHVSERAMERVSAFAFGGSASVAQGEAQQFYKCRKKPAFSEVLSALIVQLPEFVELLEVAQVPGWSAPELSERIAQLITGSTPYALRPFLSEMISGAVDADKLDYMARDCYMAGLPMPVDVERLLQKVHAVGVLSDSVPGAPWARFAGIPPGRTIYLLAIELSGGRAVEEMLVSRVLLYDKLYKHHKVRAFEGMVENILDALMENSTSFRSPETYLRISDDQFLAGDWGDVDVSTLVRDRAMDLTSRIRARETVRAFAFGPSLLLADPVTWVDKKPAFLRWSDESRAFRVRVVDRAQWYLRKNGQADLANALTPDLLVIDFPDAQRIAERTRFYVGSETAGLSLYSDAFGVDRWMEAYETSKHVGYIFCPREYTAAVHLAARDAIAEMGLSFSDGSLKLTKVSPREIATLERAAGNEVQPASEAWHVARPNVEREDIEARFAERIAGLATRFQPYENRPVDAASIVDWLLQFPRDEVPLALTVLEHVQFWTRPSLANGFAHAVKQVLPTGGAAQCVPLGGATTSAVHLQYLWDDVRSQLDGITLTPLQSILEVRAGVPILFYDDYCGSATQSRTVLMQWAGRPQSEWLVDEHHVDPLPANVADVMKGCPQQFIFAAGRTRGLRDLIAKAKALGTTDEIGGYLVSPRDVPCFDLAANVFSRSAEARIAKHGFEVAGRRALSENASRWGEDKTSKRVLGYGGAADLTVFYYNTPSSTLSALWAESALRGSEWFPLFKRRRRSGSQPLAEGAEPACEPERPGAE